MSKITVISLGPGPREHLTLGALSALEKAEKVVLRTEKCDAAAYIREKGISFDTLDHLHETCDDFEELAENAAREVLKAAENAPVCYAVLDAGNDETVRLLMQHAADIAILPGVPLSAPLLSQLPQEKTEIQTAAALSVTGTQNPLLILEVDSRMLAGECKLQLLSWYDADTEVYFFPPSTGAKRSFVKIPLCDMDRQKAYDHTAALLIPMQTLENKARYDFYDLVQVMGILRGENGCPWDKEQTHETLRKYLIEEAYETAAAIDDEDWLAVADELGDVLLQVVFQSSIGAQYGTFELSDITTAICKKMIHRHRHIFGSDHCETAEDVVDNWEKIKKEERGFKTQSEVLQGVTRGLAPLMRAAKVQKKARDVGFDWDDPTEALQKVHEEADEVADAIREKNAAHLEEELGDLFFSCVNVSRLCGVEAETALQRATEKFVNRFTAMENAILRDGKCLKDLTLSEMDVYWNGSKQGLQ
ncbi:MAG: nucleoside triphosphate pyrophosphohydrolase [Clostridia bacterium]|nr:nucleoside triphosphate pyrophosphohydrolase [Clostridia bacterium]